VPRGRVRITAPVGLGRMVTTALAPFIAAMPGVVIDLDLSERRVDLLDEGVDIAVRSSPADTADLAGKKIFESTRALFASKCYLERCGRPKKLVDLARHDLIAMRTSTTGSVWELLVRGRKQRFAFKPRLVINEMQVARHAAVEGMGIALLPSPTGTLDKLERVLPSVTGERGSMWILYAAHRSLTAAVRATVDHLLASLVPPH
jgi:DNA-binding transcriptional LysR family regulator